MNRPPFSRDRPPLDEEALERLAIVYVGRYATSRAKLAIYLRRKLAERGFVGTEEPPVAALVERFAALGYVDDKALADAKGRSLARRGFGVRRLAVALDAAGIGEADSVDARRQATAAAWDTAMRFAERRRFGPFARREQDERARRRAIAAMLRAGHSFEHARKIIAAPIGDPPVPDE